MKAAIITAVLIVLSQPARAQSLFGLGEPEPPVQCGTTAEEKQWRAIVIRQLRERVPRLALGSGTVSIRFDVDYAGRVSKLDFAKYENNAQALVAAGVIGALKLPPPPDSVERRCRSFEQTFRFHGGGEARSGCAGERNNPGGRTNTCR
ncbi:hypothetical protein [Methylosinus sp. Sm6]|uniref:hypothetical protein n=1 Tax=Methylosinus sp. Sm6 TaxID=2866948 RepID=UPI001C99B139|nr:hypothetical protein [Methylosinus sp. Sm6]MBY6242515.1 hypothetical protein [Methylosinus sp. Sm6]